MYQKNIENGYVFSIVRGVANGNITEAEYNDLMDIISNRPTAPDGYGYRLRENLTWELYELPPVTEDEETEASEADYQAALAELGVRE